MRRLVHLSDLHFGALSKIHVEPILEALHEMDPDVIVISGDLTQRARRSQFDEARAFLARLPDKPLVVVPGNHDIPLWDVFRRFAAPRRRFHSYITAERFPTHLDDEVAVVGVNTARSLTFKNGRINQEQLAEVRERLDRARPSAVRVVVAHHPFVIPEDVPIEVRVGRADLAIPIFAEIGVQLLLTGHRHRSWAGWLEVPQTGHGLLAVHAGTATSHRVRGEENSFNEILVTERTIEVRHFGWRPDEGRFGAVHETGTKVFSRSVISS